MMIHVMSNSNPRRLCLGITILLVVVTFYNAWFLGSRETSLRQVSVKIQNYGTITYADSPLSTPYTRAPPPSGVDPFFLVTFLSFLLALASAFIRSVKWLQWIAKYGKCRTPICTWLTVEREGAKAK